MIFVIFHGLFSSPEANWFPALKAQLEGLDQTVIAPQYPIDDENNLQEGVIEPTEQSLDKWDTTFSQIRAQLPPGEKLCFIGHSLGCLFALRMVEKYRIQLDSAIFVGGFIDCLPNEIWPYSKIIPSFQKTDFDPIGMQKLIPISYVLYSDTDPYVPNRQSLMFARAINGSTIPLRAAGHMNMEVNLDEFALVFDLCLTRLDISYTQKHKFLKQRIGMFEFVQAGPRPGFLAFETESSIKMQLFRFQNVHETGYSTLFTGLKTFQMAHSSYMGYARKAAQRMKHFERVILLKKLDDIQDPDTLEQIKADLASGIKISLCLYSEVVNLIPEPDFGIWDDRYICINQFDNKTLKATNTVVSSDIKKLAKAKSWWKIVKSHSFPITNLTKDIDVFLNTKHLS